jgi:hypothetical protein
LFAAAILVAGLAVPTDAAQYKWTGAASTDFATAGNWLVDAAGTWVATATPPANTYGADTIVFEGAPTANMPVLGADWKLHSIQFRSAGWTLDTGAFTLELVQYYVNYYLGVPKAVAVTSEGEGQNTILGTLWFNGGGYVTAADGSTLSHVGIITNSTDGGLSGTTKQLGFGGQGTLRLGGGSTNPGQDRFNMEGGTLLLEKSSGLAIGQLRATHGLVKLMGANQIPSAVTWCLSGDASIDFNGYAQSVNTIGIGSSPDSITVGAPWSGTLKSTQTLQIGNYNNNSNLGSLTVNSNVTHPVVFEGGLDSLNGRYSGTGCSLRIGNSTNDVDLVVDGPLLAGNTGNNATTLKILGATADGVFSVGTMALTQSTDWGGTYAKLYLSAHLLANAQDGSSIGLPSVVEVQAPYGVLGGHGLVRTATGTPVSVFGTLCPGSPTQPSGILTIGQSSANVSVVLQTNSTYRVAVAADGSCPQLQLNGPLTINADVTLRVSGDAAPASGVAHTVLRHTGARTGVFEENIVAEFPGAAACSAKLSYEVDGAGGRVVLRFAPACTVVAIR